MFDEGERRDPNHEQTWLALVDGNNDQLERIEMEAKTRQISVTILIDLIHVFGYVWAAVWCFFAAGDPKAQAWVLEQRLAILEGRALTVAAAMRRKATVHQLPPNGHPSRRVLISSVHGQSSRLTPQCPPTSTRPVHRPERSRAGRSAPGTRHSLVAEAGCEWPSRNLRKHDKTNGPNLCGV